MEENLHHIDDLFRKGLGDAEDRPSAQVWDTIAKALDEKDKPVVAARPAFRAYYAAAAALIVAGIAALVWYWSAQDLSSPISDPGQSISARIVKETEVHKPQTNQEQADQAQANQVEANHLKAIKPQTNQAQANQPNVSHASTLPKGDEQSVLASHAQESTQTLTRQAPVHRPKPGPALAILPAGSELPKAPSRSASQYMSAGMEDQLQPVDQPAMAMAMVELHRSLVTKDSLVAAAPSLGEKASGSVPGNLQNKSLSDALANYAPPAKPVQSSLSLPRVALMPVAAVSFTTNKLKASPGFGPTPGGPSPREFRETEQNNVTISPGLLAELRIGKRVTLVTGVSGFENSVDIAPKKVGIFRDPSGSEFYQIDCSLGSFFIDPKATAALPVPPDSLKIAKTSVSLHYLAIPLAVKVYGGNARFSYFATAGLEYNVLLKKDMSASLPQVLPQVPGRSVGPSRSEGVTENFTKGMIGGGVDLRINRKLALTVMPQYRFALQSSSQGTPISTYPNSFSIVTGLKISL